jgi:hypothetical protein
MIIGSFVVRIANMSRSRIASHLTSLLSLVFAMALPFGVYAQADTDIATGSGGSCTCTCTFQTGGGPETQAIPSFPGEGVTYAETREQCSTVCSTESTRRGASSVRASLGSCAAGVFASTGGGSATEPETEGGTSGSGDAGSIPLYNPLGTDLGVAEFISRAIRTVIGFVGALALLMFVYGGVMWMTAGDSKRVDTAKEILKNSTIGLLLIFFSYSIVSIVFSLLGST